MLDERSPEEMAEYFEEHKHEIPKSHEVCVRRFQTNDESIRQLDAKYGSLVAMLQGLGMKHQPLLPAKNEGEEVMDARSIHNVEKWADDITEPPGEEDIRSDPENRQSHFDRPLKEVRVGESPSRPWGISVPELGPVMASECTEPDASSKQENEKPENTPPTDQQKISSNKLTGASEEGNPRMMFTGPVFIGYPAEQAAALIRQCGLGSAQKFP